MGYIYIYILIHFYLQYIDILASNGRNYQYECFLLVTGEWSISQSIKFEFCVFSECVIVMNGTMYMLIKDASDVSNYCKENAFPFLGISVFVLDMPCVLNTYCQIVFSFEMTLYWINILVLRVPAVSTFDWSVQYEGLTDQRGSGKRKIRGFPQRGDSSHVERWILLKQHKVFFRKMNKLVKSRNIYPSAAIVEVFFCVCVIKSQVLPFFFSHRRYLTSGEKSCYKY